jgi:phospholipid-translocating ATPase
MSRFPAIGCSTNLIDTDSNLIVVRGGKHSARSQLAKAGIQFFGEHFSEEDKLNIITAADKRRSADSHALRRTNTGVSSLVGENNGNRPGGFVLVIDGLALQEVRTLCLASVVGLDEMTL